MNASTPERCGFKFQDVRCKLESGHAERHRFDMGTTPVRVEEPAGEPSMYTPQKLTTSYERVAQSANADMRALFQRIREQHPLQYGIRHVATDGHPFGETVFDPGDDPNVGERYNRCPTCEQWSPCDVRDLLAFAEARDVALPGALPVPVGDGEASASGRLFCTECGLDITPTPGQIRALRRFGNPLRRAPCLETENGLHRTLVGDAESAAATLGPVSAAHAPEEHIPASSSVLGEGEARSGAISDGVIAGGFNDLADTDEVGTFEPADGDLNPVADVESHYPIVTDSTDVSYGDVRCGICGECVGCECASKSMWNLRTLAECVLDAPQDRGINVGLARDLARAALAADADLARREASLSSPVGDETEALRSALNELVEAARLGRNGSWLTTAREGQSALGRLLARVAGLEEDVQAAESNAVDFHRDNVQMGIKLAKAEDRVAGLEARNALLLEEVRVREESQIPVVPRAAQEKIERLEAREASLRAERDAFRIEADCALRDYDDLELKAGDLRRALEQIANPRPNKTFDPWARDVARAALAALADSGEAGL